MCEWLSCYRCGQVVLCSSRYTDVSVLLPPPGPADLSRTVEESERILDAIQLTAVMEDSQSICDFATSLKSVESNLDTQCSDLHK